MAQVIKLKRGTTNPTTGNIADGEVAINKSNKTLHMNDGGTIKQIGGTPGINDQASSTALTITSGGLVQGVWNNNGTSNTSSQIRKLTQAQYDAIGTKDSNTLYIIVG